MATTGNTEAKARSLTAIMDEFNMSLYWIIVTLEGTLRSDADVANMSCLRRRLSILVSAGGDIVPIDKSSYTFIKMSEILLSRPKYEEFISSVDITALCAAHGVTPNNSNDSFILDLLNAIRVQYVGLHQNIKDGIYNKINGMLACAIEYVILQQK
jgi:hypothetical protein